MSGRRIIEQTASYSQVKLSGDCISVLFIRLCPSNEHYRDLTDSADDSGGVVNSRTATQRLEKLSTSSSLDASSDVAKVSRRL